MRFSLYILQLNIVSICVFLYFGNSYRKSEEGRTDDVIDSTDLLSLTIATLTCAVLFTPWLSEPLIKACSDKVVLEAAPDAVNRRSSSRDDSAASAG